MLVFIHDIQLLAYVFQSIQTSQNGLRIQIQFSFKYFEVASIFCSIFESLLIHDLILLLPEMALGKNVSLSVSNLARIDKHSAVRALKHASLG